MIKRGLAILLTAAALIPASAGAVVRPLVAIALDSSASDEMESFEGMECMAALAQIRAERNMTLISSDVESYRFVLQGAGKTGAIAVLHCQVSTGSPD